MRGTLVIGLLLLAQSASAIESDCPRWRRVDADARRAEVERIIARHLDSNASKQYSSENAVAMRRCLTGFTSQIVEDFDETCVRRPDGNSELLDDVFDRYLLSCVQ